MEQRFGRYLLERILGTGTFATVWLATDEDLAGRVAVKVLADNWARHADVRRRFVDEAKLLFRIDHERIVRVHLIDETPDGRPYIVMTWADRATLQERLMDLRLRGALLPVELALTYTQEIAESLHVVHSVGVVHRDVKPSNVLFRSLQPHQRRAGLALGDELMLLGDFGLAKHLAGESGFTLAAGTPAYMAPEQSLPSSELDPRADVFAATAVLFEMLTGKVPFSADTLTGVGRAHQGGLLPRLDRLRPGLPSGLQDVVDCGLESLPADRFDSAAALGAAVAAIAGGPVSPAPIPHPDRPSAVDFGDGPGPAVGEIVEWVGRRVNDAANRAVIAEARTRLRERPRVAIFGPMTVAAPIAWMIAGEQRSAMTALGPDMSVVRLVAGDDRAELRRGDTIAPVAVERDSDGQLHLRGPAPDGDELRVATPSRRLQLMTVVATSDPAVVLSADAALVVLPADVAIGLERVNELRGHLRASRAGPVLLSGVLVASGLDAAHADDVVTRYYAEPTAARTLRELLVVDSDDPSPLDAHLGSVVWAPAEVVASAGVALLELCLRSPEPGARKARGPAHERLDALRLAYPALDELAVLRDEASGRVTLPDSLRFELRTVLGAHDIDRRLGLLPGSVDADRRTAAEAALDRWRTALNSGQIPFASRSLAEVVCGAYERLWAMAAP